MIETRVTTHGGSGLKQTLKFNIMKNVTKVFKKFIAVAFNGVLCAGALLAMIGAGQGSWEMIVLTVGGFISATVILDK